MLYVTNKYPSEKNQYFVSLSHNSLKNKEYLTERTFLS